MDMDKIHLKDLECYCKLGVYNEERSRGQCVHIDLELEVDLKTAGNSDDVKDTISYVDISIATQDIVAAKPYHLIEHLCTEICNGLLAKFDKLNSVHIKVHKPIINATWFAGKASIEMKRNR